MYRFNIAIYRQHMTIYRSVLRVPSTVPTGLMFNVNSKPEKRSPCSTEAWRMDPEVPSMTLMLPRLVTARMAFRPGWYERLLKPASSQRSRPSLTKIHSEASAEPQAAAPAAAISPLRSLALLLIRPPGVSADNNGCLNVTKKGELAKEKVKLRRHWGSPSPPQFAASLLFPPPLRRYVAPARFAEGSTYKHGGCMRHLRKPRNHSGYF